MSSGARAWPGYRAAAAAFVVAGILTFGFIPGLGLLLVLAGASIGLIAVAIRRAGRRSAPRELWLALAAALLGILVTFTIHPILGAALALAGVGLAIGRTLLEWFETPREKLRRTGSEQ